MSTMTTMKTLTLAALGALSIGVGAAMAEGSGVTGPDYWAAKQQAAALQPATANSNNTAASRTVQYGSGDVERPLNQQGVGGVAGGF